MKQNIELSIENMVLHGFSLNERYRIGGAVEYELTRLLSESGIPSLLSQSGEFAHLNGRECKIMPRSKPEVAGTQIAWAVYGGLSK